MKRIFSLSALRMSQKRISYKVEGTVQGVFFRQSTQEEAEKLGVTGYVQNDPEGTVSGQAQGSDSQLKDFVQFLNKGPRQAKVSKVNQSEIDVKEGESGFRS